MPRLQLRTACPLDCPDTCSLAVVVDDGRLVAVDAGEGNPLTAGFICQKVKHHAHRVYSPERVLEPLVRNGPKGSGRFEPVSWDRALDVVATRMRESIDSRGPGSVVPYLYNSSAGLLASEGLTPRLFERLGASQVLETICAATAGAAWQATFGAMLSADVLDVVDAELVVVWGANPTVSNIHFPPLVNQARATGARVVVVDPRRTAMAARADLHLAVRPGTDVVVALAAARRLAERDLLDRAFLAEHASGVDAFLAACEPWTLERAALVAGVAERDIATLADWYASVRPAFTRVGWGIERNRNGGSAIRAVFALSVLTGQFGQVGAGVMTSLSKAVPRVRRAVPPSTGSSPPRRRLNMNRLGADLCDPSLEPPISVLFVQGANPAVMNPNQRAVLRGLGRDDLFTVVHDQVITDTARWADVVLPATTHFEAPDVAPSYGSYVLQSFPAVIERVGQSRTNDEVASALAERLGVPAADFDPAPDRLAAEVLGPFAEGVHRLRGQGATVQFGTTRPDFPDGRARLDPPIIGVPTFRPVEERFPLTLLSPATHRTINSIFGERREAAPVIGLHPDDAGPRGIRSGDRVRVENEQGSVEVTARVDADLRPGVAVLPKGMWCAAYVSDSTVNLLVPDALNDLAGGACFNDARVEVTRI